MRDWVDLTKNDIFTASQLKRRKVAHIRSKYSVEDEIELIRGLIRGAPEDRKYTDWLEEVEAAEQKATTDNALLKETIAYEGSTRRLAKYLLSVGVKRVPETPETRDKETGEITQEFVPEIKEIKPVDATVKVKTYDPEGVFLKEVTEPNPEIVRDLNERYAAQSVVDKATAETLTLVVQRSGNETRKHVGISR